MVRKTLDRLDACIRALKGVRGKAPYADLDQLCYDIKNGFTTAMDDDLNISAALASLFAVIKRINTIVMKGEIDAAGRKRCWKPWPASIRWSISSSLRMKRGTPPCRS